MSFHRLTATLAFVWCMALAPLLWVGWRSFRGQRIDRAYWLLGAAMAVSWLADLPGVLGVNSWVPSMAYPVSQSAIVGAVVIPTRRHQLAFAGIVAAGGVLAVLLQSPTRPEIVLHSIAWLGLSWVLLGQWELGALRSALLVYFGLGWVAWFLHWSYVGTHPNLHGAAPTWYVYQAVRLLGLVWLCYAASVTRTPLRVVAR